MDFSGFCPLRHLGRRTTSAFKLSTLIARMAYTRYSIQKRIPDTNRYPYVVVQHGWSLELSIKITLQQSCDTVYINLEARLNYSLAVGMFR